MLIELVSPFVPVGMPRSVLVVFVLSVVFAGIGSGESVAQQVLVDEPSSVPPGAARLEAWHSSEESRMIPALRVHPRLEVAGGTAFLHTGTDARRTVEHMLEGKGLLRPADAHRLGLAAVVGARMSGDSGRTPRPKTLYASVLASQALLPDRLTVYQRVGSVHEKSGPARLAWGFRLDARVVDRLTMIGEVEGVGRAAPSAQMTLRAVLLPDHVEMDLSLTRADLGDEPNTWATVGLSFMSDPLF